ncbi:hypothetical protein M405DRAFT_822251 [Rhizopogon salebrosus TDB-379]|nr:hypothetical protein M405DRAFT_822251 [Rhizopogon salebrosus TDB-379]
MYDVFTVGVSHISVFARKWTPVSAEWNDPQAEQDMSSVLKMRTVVLSLLEKLWGTSKHLKNSLEADVDIILPYGLSVRPYLLQLIERGDAFLKTLCRMPTSRTKALSALVHLRGLMSLQWPYPVCFANLIPCVYLMILRRPGHERGGGDSRETFILE